MHLDELVGRARGEPLSVGTELDRRDGLGVAGQGELEGVVGPRSRGRRGRGRGLGLGRRGRAAGEIHPQGVGRETKQGERQVAV